MLLFSFHERYLRHPLFALKEVIYKRTEELVTNFRFTPDDQPLDENQTIEDLHIRSGSRLFCDTVESWTP